MKCRLMRHFSWVFTVCQSTQLGFSRPQRVNIANIMFFFKQMRYTKNVSVWPVGLISSLKAEGCIVKDGKVCIKSRKFR